MYKIKILKHKKKEKIPTPPKFENEYDMACWYRKQEMKSTLLQIKHVSIQYKDIQQMLFASDKRLVNLYMRTDFTQIDDLNKYIQISRFKDGCDIIVYLIITSDWLVNQEEIEQQQANHDFLRLFYHIKENPLHYKDSKNETHPIGFT